MPNPIDRDLFVPSNQRPPHPAYGHRRLLFLVFAVLALVLLTGQTWLSYYVDALWFGSLGYREVFLKTLRLEWAVFAAFAVVTFFILYGAILALKRMHRDDLPAGQTIFVGGQPLRLPVEPIL
ncbi:MAG: UPF0182 family protein, partial [Terriglobia bacterium]